jgi:hypothetical protein
MKKLFPIILLFISCSKSNETKPAPVSTQKKVLMRVQYSNGATAVIDGVYIGATAISGSYSASGQDSVNSPNGLAPLVYVHGGNGTDHVTLIDQNNKKQDAVISTNNPAIITLSNFYTVDSFTIKVYR